MIGTDSLTVRPLLPQEVSQAANIWNSVVEDGIAFPQTEPLTEAEAGEFFRAQTETKVCADKRNGRVLGLYILHPNNVGRCGHIGNASFAVRKDSRGLHIGEMLVKDCLDTAREKGFRIMQFNAVVASNIHARHLYERLGFTQLGVIPDGFRLKDGRMEDICPYFKVL